jgi:purine-nucleoside phosphorylase
MGINNLIVTNAAGGVSRALNPGDLMLISDHISLFAPIPLKGPNLEELGTRFPDMSEVYNKNLIKMAEEEAGKIGVCVKKGVYCFTPGPMYETPSEIRLLSTLGVDAVGMSTVSEVIAAKHAKMNVLGISCITNMASGILPQPLSHDEVTQTANRVANNFTRLLEKIITGWNL